MKKSLIEELERIHSLTYGKNVIIESDFLDKLFGKKSKEVEKFDDPKKADLVSDDVIEFFNTLESIESPIFQQNRGGMTFQKNVETVQMGLVLLGYQLPKFGVDGLFGPETANSVNKFKTDNNVEESQSINESTLSSPIPIIGVNSQYGAKRKYETHPGVDLKAQSGTEIKSPSDGKVIDAKFKDGGCGGTIQIQHNSGFTSRFCHCKDIIVNIGQEVKQGEVVGLSGGKKGDKGAGNSQGEHLHFELKKDGKLVDPMDYIGTSIDSYDLTKTSVSGSKSVITPEMVTIIINKLKERGVTSEDLKKLVDPITSGGGAEFTDLDLSNDEDYSKYATICQKFIDTKQPNPLSITGDMLAKGAKNAYDKYKRFVPAELALAQLVLEGGIGNSNLNARPIRTKNPFNVGNVDSGSNQSYGNVQSAINTYYDLIAKNYLGGGKTAKDLITNFVNRKGSRYASSNDYEKKLSMMATQANRIGSSIV